MLCLKGIFNCNQIKLKQIKTNTDKKSYFDEINIMYNKIKKK